MRSLRWSVVIGRSVHQEVELRPTIPRAPAIVDGVFTHLAGDLRLDRRYNYSLAEGLVSLASESYLVSQAHRAPATLVPGIFRRSCRRTFCFFSRPSAA